MKSKFYTFNHALPLPAMIGMLAVFLFSIGTAHAQNLNFNTITGYTMSVNPGPTICETSSTSMTTFYFPFFSVPDAPESTLTASEGTHHTATAGETTIVTLDIPAAGYLAQNWQLIYKYGEPGDLMNLQVLQQSDNPPTGVLHFDIPVTFSKDSSLSYLTFIVRDQTGDPSAPIYQSYQFVIPFTVLGVIDPQIEVPILDTVVEPQIPYLILHAPPGDGSSSAFQDSKTTCRNFQTNYAEDGSNSANLAVKLGIAGSAGIFVTTNFEFSVTMSAGLTVGDMAVVTTSDQTCVTVNEGFTTSALTGPNGGGDVFIGYGTDLALGVYDYRYLPEGSCTSDTKQGLIYVPVGLPRKFIYTKEAIDSEIAELEIVVADSLINGPEATNNAQNQIDVWNQVLEMNLANVNNPDNELLGNTSFSASTSSTNESSITVLETNTIQYEHYIQGNIGVTAVVEVGGSGITGGYEYKASKRFGETQNQTEEGSKLINYTLADDDGGDLFNLSVVKDPMYGTPIFRMDPGTKSSCPYQGGYQRDQPLLTFADDSDNLTLNNIPIGGTTNFQIKICNESNENRTYYLKGNAVTNLNGAIIQGFGNNIFNTNDNGVQFLNVPANDCIDNASLTISQSDDNILNYENLEIFLYTLCEGADTELSSSVFLNAFFSENVGINDIDMESTSVQIVPNPNNGMFNLRFENDMEAGSISINDMTGKTIVQRNLQAGQSAIEFNEDDLASGMYIITIRSGESLMTRKLIVN